VPKNASLSNKPFDEKVEGKPGEYAGYRYGSYAENEVAKVPEWTPASIVERGRRLLEFMDTRWSLGVGPDKLYTLMINLDSFGSEAAQAANNVPQP
jgi:hypothetical protein